MVDPEKSYAPPAARTPRRYSGARSQAGPQDRFARQEVRKKIDLLDNKIDLLDQKVDRNHEELKQRIERLRKAAFGESVLGQYTVAEVEERLDAIEGRLSALEQRR